MSKRRKSYNRHGVRVEKSKAKPEPEFVTVEVDPATGEGTIRTNIADQPERMFTILLTGLRGMYRSAAEGQEREESRILRPRFGLPANGRG